MVRIRIDDAPYRARDDVLAVLAVAAGVLMVVFVALVTAIVIVWPWRRSNSRNL